MRALLLLVLAAGCQAEKSPTVASGSGSAPAPRDASTCDLDGSYRLRFRSNGADGWWMRLKISGGKVQSISDAGMLGFDSGRFVASTDVKVCTLTLTGKTHAPGEVKVALSIVGNQVAGTVTRTDAYQDKISPIAGLRETGPPKLPACIHPGVYEIAVANVKTWKLDGHPRLGGCKAMADWKTAVVRLELVGDDLVVYEVQREAPFDQTFGRGDVRRLGDCQAVLSIEVQDFALHGAKLELAGDKITGTTTDHTYTVMEDGTAGENQWSCHTSQGDVIWKRLAD